MISAIAVLSASSPKLLTAVIPIIHAIVKMPPISYGTMTMSEIQIATCATVAALNSCGLSGCLFGSAACKVYGSTRTPNDIDIVVLGSTLGQEELKKRIVTANPAFFLVSSTNRRNTYKILWYNLRALDARRSRACKIDILIPGTMNIPSFPIKHIVYASVNGTMIPVMPFSPMLLLKLQGWSDHLLASRMDLFNKRHVDVQDIREILQIALDNKGLLADAGVLDLPAPFLAAGRLRVGQFIRLFPDTKAQWDAIELLLLPKCVP